MYRKIDDFLAAWKDESAGTQKLFDALTQESLTQSVADGHRTIARLAWHIITSISEMAKRTGLAVAGPDPESKPPARVEDFRKAYRESAASLAAQVRANWDDATLEIKDDMYGQQWARGKTLAILQAHEVHHRGQLTVLMRQAGITLPGIYGPSKEEWSSYNMPAPEV
jgi:uncharacterized damage-inducible protein DinB